VQSKLRESVSIKDFGAAGNGIDNDFAEEIAAHAAAAGRAVVYPYQNGESYLGTTAALNLYGNSTHTRALHSRIQAGIATNPTDLAQPILWVQKVSDANRTTVPTNWDQAGYVSLIKKDGDAYGASLTGYGLYQGGTGDLIGVHGRVKCQTNDARVYAGWYYADIDAGFTPTATHALELNANNKGTDLGYLGKAQLLRLCMADNASDGNRFSTAVSVGFTTTGGNNGVYTGIHIERNSVIPSATPDGEAVRIDAPQLGTGSIGGVRFSKLNPSTDLGVFKYAVRTDEATFNNENVFLLGVGHRVRWGDISTGMYVTGGSTSFVVANGIINVANPVGGGNTVLQGAGVQLLSTRKTGWTAATGTATRTEFVTSTVTLEQLAQRVKALTDDLISHGLIGA
jgi:hypothetical protein